MSRTRPILRLVTADDLKAARTRAWSWLLAVLFAIAFVASMIVVMGALTLG